MKLVEHPIRWANRLAVMSRKLLALQFGDAGVDLTVEEWAVLLLLWNQDGQNPSQLSDLTFRDRTATTRLIDRLENKALVEREQDADDRRRSIIRLTKKGKEIRPKAVKAASPIVVRGLQGISERDLKTTTKTLMKIADNLIALMEERK